MHILDEIHLLFLLYTPTNDELLYFFDPVPSYYLYSIKRFGWISKNFFLTKFGAYLKTGMNLLGCFTIISQKLFHRLGKSNIFFSISFLSTPIYKHYQSNWSFIIASITLYLLVWMLVILSHSLKNIQHKIWNP